MKAFAALFLTLSSLSMSVFADKLPAELKGMAPAAKDVKPKLQPPEGFSAYDVFYGTGHRVYQCNPERTGFQHWYAVQTHMSLYPTKDRKPPYNVAGLEIGSISVAPMNGTQPDPMDVIPVMYYYPDGSWVGTSRPLATTTLEEGRAARGDANNLDDHLEPGVYRSSGGYLSHANYIVRIGTLNGAVPAADTCTAKGMIVIKPFTAFYMVYTNAEGHQQLGVEKDQWDQLVQNLKPKGPAGFP
ncbi:hypothetical protein BX666DRAFT_1992768 [Dichotomocladium elegans]|nr:hypothetical protein BX666DRAFT_1992768 [Dichotomocladium elegans]